MILTESERERVKKAYHDLMAYDYTQHQWRGPEAQAREWAKIDLSALVRDCVLRFSAARGIDANARVEIAYPYHGTRQNKYPPYMELVHIWSSLGALRKNMWTNKVGVSIRYHEQMRTRWNPQEFAEKVKTICVKSQRATTDPRFLDPMQHEFMEFIRKLQDEIEIASFGEEKYSWIAD